MSGTNGSAYDSLITLYVGVPMIPEVTVTVTFTRPTHVVFTETMFVR